MPTPAELGEVRAAAVALVTCALYRREEYPDLLDALLAELPDGTEIEFARALDDLGASVRQYGPSALPYAGLAVARWRYLPHPPDDTE